MKRFKVDVRYEIEVVAADADAAEQKALMLVADTVQMPADISTYEYGEE
jgi:hypothetical protein